MSALVLASGIACQESEQRVVVQAPPGCDGVQEALADGIQTGDELVLAFDCVNADGQYQSLEPVLYALNTAQAPGGAALLDLWVEAINNKLQSGGGRDVNLALTPDDIAELVAQAADFMDSGAPEAALDLAAEAIDKDVASGAMYWGQWLGQGGAAMHAPDAEVSLDAWLGALQAVICGDLPSTGVCRSNLQLALQGMANHAEPTTYNAGDPANDDLREALDWLLYVHGDVDAATKAHQGLAKALAYMAEPITLPGDYGEGSVMEFALASVIPRLYGDNPATTYAVEGYPSRDARASALYGLMVTLSQTEVQEALAASSDEQWQLISHYYKGDSGVLGNAEGFREEVCLSPEDKEDTFGTANNGLEQLIRLMANSDVDYDQTPLSCQGIFKVAIPLVAPHIELSGDKSIGGLILEVFAQLPLEVIQFAAGVLNYEPVVQLSNRLCGLNLQHDDTEALEAAVNMVQTMNMVLPLLDAINRANAMPAVVELLSAMWSTPALCELGPTTRLFLNPQAPDATPKPGLDYFPQPDLPLGSTPHDQITAPLLAATLDIGRHAPTLLAPFEWSLIRGEADLVQLLLAIGRMAHQSDSALGEVALITAELSQLNLGGGPVNLEPAARALSDEQLVFALFATLASPEVIDAVVQGEGSAPGLLTKLSDQIKDGTLTGYLKILSAVLSELDAQLRGEISQGTDTDLTKTE